MAKKILLVDDETDILQTVQLSLEMEGYEILTACDGKKALDKAQEHLPDLIVLDVMLPSVDGYQIARILKSNTRSQHIPIIMLTARAQKIDRELGERTGADYYMTKPFDLDQFIKKVEELLALSK